MIENSYYSQDNLGPYEMIDIGDLALEEGVVIRGCRLAVATHGTLNDDKSNAILVPTWYSGTSKIMEEIFIGAGRALDPAKYFIIVVNQIGNGLSVSPHTTEGAMGMGNFPRIRIGDDVVAQHRLVTEHFGIETLALVVGASMGAQQTYEWAVRFPDMVERAAPIAGFAQNTPHDIMYTQTLMESLTSDPGWNGGFYERGTDVRAGLERHAKLWSVMGWSPEFYAQGRFRDLGHPTLDDFIRNFMCAFFAPMDPNALLTMAWKWQQGDVARHTGGDLAAALGRITARTFVMPISHDMFFPVADCEREQKLIPGSELRVIETIDGHLGLFATDESFPGQIDRHLNDLLAS